MTRIVISRFYKEWDRGYAVCDTCGAEAEMYMWSTWRQHISPAGWGVRIVNRVQKDVCQCCIAKGVNHAN